MASFKIYRYQFSPIMDCFVPTLFHSHEQIEEDITKLMNNKTIIFNENFNKCKFLYRNKVHSILEIFHEDSLRIFKIDNKKKRIIERDFEKQHESDEPSIIVIIDNKEGIQRIAIQEKTVAFSKIDMVVTILENSFNKMLREFKLEVNIQKEYYENEFWDYVKEYKNNISYVRFEFDYPNLPSLVESSIKDLLKDISKDTLSEKSAIEFRSENGLDLKEENKELQNLNKGSAELGNPILLKIKGLRKTIKTGENTRTLEIDEADLSPDNIETIRSILNEL